MAPFTDDDMIVTGIILLIIGVAMYLGARQISFNHLKKYYRKNGVEEIIRNDTGNMPNCVALHKANSNKRMLKYIKSVDLEGGQYIERMLAAQAQAKK